MKNNIIATVLFLVVCALACNTATTDQINTKAELLHKFMHITNELDLDRVNGKVIVLNSNFCKNFECPTYFDALKDEIQFYSREDAFMRGLKNYLEIEKIDTKQGKMTIQKRTKDKIETIVIQ